MTEREQFIEHRLKHLREMMRELERERAEIRQRRTDAYDAYLDRIETSCNASMEIWR